MNVLVFGEPSKGRNTDIMNVLVFGGKVCLAVYLRDDKCIGPILYDHLASNQGGKMPNDHFTYS